MSESAHDVSSFHTPVGSGPPSRPTTPSNIAAGGSNATLKTMVNQNPSHNNLARQLSAGGTRILREISEKGRVIAVHSNSDTSDLIHPFPIEPQAEEEILEEERQPPEPGIRFPKLNKRLKYIVKPMAIASTLLLIVLWATALWIYGGVHNAQHRAYKLKVLVRDLDGGIIGQTLLRTIAGMHTHENPGWTIASGTLEEVRHLVWTGKYWGALVVNEGASAALEAALRDPTTPYNASHAITSYLTGSRYFTTYSSYIRPGVTQALLSTAGQVSAFAAKTALSAAAPASDAMAGLIAQPVSYTEDDMAPLPFQARVFLNTFGVVVPNLATFFFNMIVMGVFTETGVYSHPTTMWKLTKAKFTCKMVWCFLASLIMTSVNFSFRESYTYPAKNFFALWTDTLFYCWINYNIFGTLLAFLPVRYIMYFVFPIIVTSVSASVFPPEVGDLFYNISYIFPSHAYWMIAITIWGKGCCNQLKTYCPVVMTWIIVTELVWLSGDWHLSRKSRQGSGVPPEGKDTGAHPPPIHVDEE